LIIGLIVLAIYYLQLRKKYRGLQAEIQRLRPTVNVNRFTGQVGPFSLGSILGSMQDLLNDEPDEQQPLIPNRFENVGREGVELQNVHSNSSSVSDDTFLRHRTEFAMTTFKPSAPTQDKVEVNESSV